MERSAEAFSDTPKSGQSAGCPSSTHGGRWQLTLFLRKGIPPTGIWYSHYWIIPCNHINSHFIPFVYYLLCQWYEHCHLWSTAFFSRSQHCTATPALRPSSREAGPACSQRTGFGARACRDQDPVQLPPTKPTPGQQPFLHFDFNMRIWDSECCSRVLHFVEAFFPHHKCRDEFRCGLTFSQRGSVFPGLRVRSLSAKLASKKLFTK